MVNNEELHQLRMRAILLDSSLLIHPSLESQGYFKAKSEDVN